MNTSKVIEKKMNRVKGRNFRDFAIFGKIRESLFPQNICYLYIAKVYSREKKIVLDSRWSRNLKICIYRK